MRDVTSLIVDLLPSIDRTSFVQIGAGDGVSGDPIHQLIIRHRWTGVMVEPVPYLFNQLTRNYAGLAGLRFENCAIGETSGNAKFWYLRESQNEQLPNWYNQLGTLKLENLLKHESELPDLKSLIVQHEVRCKSLRELILSAARTTFDLLLVDAEGYDDAIVKQVDGESVNPNLIVFERKHLDQSQTEICYQHLRFLGYEIIESYYDAVAARNP
jgi:FkbM family methyltransferase